MFWHGGFIKDEQCLNLDNFEKLYEQIIGEAFKPESITEAETFELIRDNLNTLGIH